MSESSPKYHKLGSNITRPLKRVKIEKLFENLTLEEREKVWKMDEMTGDKRLARWDSFKSYSIEIHKVHHYDDYHDGDVLPRKRKKAKQEPKFIEVEDSKMSFNLKPNKKVDSKWDFK